MKILNLYCGIGGNRKLWGDEHEVTAVEYDADIAAVYKSLFPNDNVIVGDAHQYLLDHYFEFDFVWGSPPCPSHSRINYAQTRTLDYPDMRLYQEVILLTTWFKGLWVIENVIPYYEPLIKATEIDRHLFWSNFNITPFQPKEKAFIRMQGKRLCIDRFSEIFGFDLTPYKLRDKRKALRNCVHPETGQHVLNCALGVEKNINTNQLELF